MNQTVRNVLVAAALTGLAPSGAFAQVVVDDREGNATPEQISVLPGQDFRNYAPWDSTKAKVPALPLPAYINFDSGVIAEGSNPGANNIFRTRVFDLDFAGVSIPLCPDGSIATHTNVVVQLDFTGDQSQGTGVDLFARIFVNGDTVLDGVDLVGDQVNGQKTIKFKQLVAVEDLASVQLLVSYQTLEAGSMQFNWTMDHLAAELAPDCVVLGDAELDFPLGSPNTAVSGDPGGYDVDVHESAPAGTVSGWDASDVRFRYDADNDLMYVAINTLSPGGDADGNLNTNTTADWMRNLGGIDYPNYSGYESVVVVIDVNQDLTPDVILGTNGFAGLNDFELATYKTGHSLLSAFSGFGTPLTANVGQVLSAPQSVVAGNIIQPTDLIMTISNWSTLPLAKKDPLDNPIDDEVRAFSFLMYQGSTADLGVGEEWSPGRGEFAPVEIPEEEEEPEALGSIGNLVWHDIDEDGIFDEGVELGLPGVVVRLINANGNEIAQQVTNADGSYLFNDLPQGNYTVEVTPSNFDDCGMPIYKSGKFALEGGLQFNGSNVTYQPDVTSVGSSFSITALVQPVLGEWATIVEKGSSAWPYALWINPEGELHLGINSGNGLEYSHSDSKLTGALEHISVTFDGSTVSFYFNGILDSTVDVTATVSDSLGDLFIGRNYQGTINDVRIYGSAIDAATVTGLASMNCGALVDFYQTTIIGGVDDNTNKATPFNYDLAEGEDFLGADFGYNQLGSIGNTVWCEEDGDGFFEPQDGEKGIAGVQVLLKDASGTVIATVLTDKDGQYIFQGLPAGAYTVEVPSTGANIECVPALASIDNVSTGHTYEIVAGVEEGDTFYTDRDYTIHTISEALEDAEFIRTANDDRNITANGLLTFTLSAESEVFAAFYSNGHKPSWLANDGWTSTDETLKITDRCNVWRYTVYRKTLPAGQVVLNGPGACAPMYGIFAKTSKCGVLADKLPTASQNDDSGDGASRISPHAVNLGSGQDYILADFGYILDKPQACIGDLVFFDCDGDGLFEPNRGEYGIKGVRILLKDATGSVIDIQYTDADGRYLFENLAPGCYTVKVSNRNFYCGSPLYRYTQVADRSNSDLDDVNRCQPLCVCIEEGDCFVKADFGYRHYCSYHYCGNYWRYNYSTRCWEKRRYCTNCWVVAD
ncbi:SdrD B-like domain-containing protein [Verrucomicrobiaceae bacterium 227]